MSILLEDLVSEEASGMKVEHTKNVYQSASSLLETRKKSSYFLFDAISKDEVPDSGSSTTSTAPCYIRSLIHAPDHHHYVQKKVKFLMLGLDTIQEVRNTDLVCLQRGSLEATKDYRQNQFRSLN